jgi:hypothetical protein
MLTQLAVFTAPAVKPGSSGLLPVSVILACNAQPDPRDRHASGLGNLLTALLAVGPPLSMRQPAAGALDRIFDRRIDLVLDRSVFGKSSCHLNLHHAFSATEG